MSITTPVLIPVPFCNSGNKATIPVNTPTSPDEANYASYEAGFPPITMIPTEANGIPPRGLDFNGILYVISSNIQNWNAGVQMKFNSDFCTAIGGYPLGAVLQSNDGKTAYVSAIENNTGDFNSNPELIGTDWILYGGGGGDSIRFADAAGESDIITVTYPSPVTELEDGMIVCFRATAANVTSTPSFNPDGLGAVTIVKGADLPLAAGDIGGEGYLVLLQYSATWNKWVLQNPATGITGRTVVDTYSSEQNWYRKWSDGWVEQGGIAPSTGGVGSLTVITLNVPSDVSYFGAAERPSAIIDIDSSSSTYLYNQKEKTSINYYQAFNTSGSPICWYACGMEAS